MPRFHQDDVFYIVIGYLVVVSPLNDVDKDIFCVTFLILFFSTYLIVLVFPCP